MFFTRKPYQIDSVYYVDNTLRIGCDCQAFSETLTGCKDCFKDAKGRITVSVFSPASNIISIKVLSHHAEPKTKGYSVIELSPSGFGTLDDSGEYFVSEPERKHADLLNIGGYKFAGQGRLFCR